MTDLSDSIQRTDRQAYPIKTYERIDDHEVLDAFIEDITDGTIPMRTLSSYRQLVDSEMNDLSDQLKIPNISQQETSNRIRNKECTLIIIDVCIEASEILKQRNLAERKGWRTEAGDLNAQYKAKIQEIYDNKVHAIVKKVTSVYDFAGINYQGILRDSKRKFFEQ